MALYYSKLSALRPDFSGKYGEWFQCPESAYKFSLADFNDRFNKYRRLGCPKGGDQAESVDYNQSVDELLRITTHVPFATESVQQPHSRGACDSMEVVLCSGHPMC